MQPLWPFSQELRFLPDWLNTLILQPQQETDQLSKSLTLLTAPFSVLSHFSASGFEIANMTRANAHYRCNYICPPTIYIPTVLTSIQGCKISCHSWDLLSHCFLSCSPTDSHKWLSTGTKVKNTPWIKHYLHKTTTTKSIYATTFKPWSSLDISLLSISYQLLSKQII